MTLNVIVCGTIRTDLEAYLVFQDLIAARQSGAIARIVYCTWPTQIQQAVGFMARLADAGVEIITTPQPAPSAFNVQVVPFYTALALFDDGDMVARVRTDKCFPLVRTLIRDADRLVAKSRAIEPGSMFQSRIVVCAIAWNELFAHGDFFMLARAGDLRKICHLDAYFDLFCSDVGAETRWFAHPYVQSYPDLRAVFEAVSLLKLSNALGRWAAHHAEDAAMAILPESLGRILGQYIFLCGRDFALMNDQPGSQSLTLLDAYAGRDPSRWQWGPRVFATSQDWLRRISSSHGLGPLGQYVDWAHDADLTKRSVSAADLDTIRAFAAEYGGEAVSRPWPGRIVKAAEPNLAAMKIYGWGSFKAMLINLVAIVEPNFDRSIITDDMAALGARFTDYPSQNYGDFPMLCRDTGDAILAHLQTRYSNEIPTSALSLPALFYACSLTFCWDAVAGEWLADQLLAGRLNPHFSQVTRWGLVARFWVQKPETVYKAAQLLLRGIGGPVDAEHAKRLLDHAARTRQAEHPA